MPATLVDLLRHRAQAQPSDTAFVYLIDGEEEQISITYHELDRQARAIGAWLKSQGLTGERALLVYQAGLEFVTTFFGCLYGGVVAVPIYPPRRNRSLGRVESVTNDADAHVALTTEEVLARIDGIVDETPDLRQVKWLTSCNVPQGIEDEWTRPDIDSSTVAFLQYTSGSTGTPKGVVLTHSNLLHNSALITYGFEHTRSGKGVFWLPNYHDMGLIGGVLQPIYCGRPNVLMSPMAFLQRPFRWLSAISRFRGTTSGGPNFAFDLCVRKIKEEERKQLDLSSWNVAFNGAEPIRAETIHRFCEAFEPCGFRREAFYPCYGMAEASLIISGGWAVEPPVVRNYDGESINRGKVERVDGEAPDARELVGSGSPLKDMDVVIADPQTKKRLKDREVGEIWVRGPSIAQGYWRNEEASRETFGAFLSDSGDGPFLRTGDLGFLDDGELFVTGRIKDILIFNGVNYYPQDIEFTVQRTNERLRADAGAVFAFDVDSSGRQRLVIVQEVERRHQGDWNHIFSDIRRRVAAEHELTVSDIILIKPGSIPKTSSGKIQHHACRDAFLNGALKVVTEWHIDEWRPGDMHRNSAIPAGRNNGKKGAEPINGEKSQCAEVRAANIQVVNPLLPSLADA